MNKMIDLRSDTVTLPCDTMLKMMCEAKLGDDFYKDDQSTNDLEHYCADFFGKEAALFMSTGTLANQIAIRSHTVPGDDVIIDATYHINYYESASTADLAKVALNTVRSPNGILDINCVEDAISSKNRSSVSNHVSLICVENTINHHAGKIFPLDVLKKLYNFALEKKIKVHLDGARLLNACVATGISVKAYTENTDSLMVSFNKGLGAPFGAILLGTKEFIHKAQKYRKWYGGGLHQSGLMASTALFALKNNIKQLTVDHRNARILAKQLSGYREFTLVTQEIDTNIIMFSMHKIGMSSIDFVNMAKAAGVLLYPWDRYTVRAVTHKNVTENDIFLAAEIMGTVASLEKI